MGLGGGTWAGRWDMSAKGGGELKSCVCGPGGTYLMVRHREKVGLRRGRGQDG